MSDAETVWESHYSSRERIWSGSANAALVREVAGMRPGTALDVGCGEGGDAIWLASEGWTVTASDVSATALARGAARSAEAGVADRIDWQRNDLTLTFPSGLFDLVSVQFFHSWEGPSRDPVLRAAASAVRAGGILLIVSHGAPPPWADVHGHDAHFDTPDETVASLRLGDEWDVEQAALVDRDVTDPDGRPAMVSDSVVRARRR